MSKISKMTGVAVAIQSALGIVKTITAISKAAPGVVTATHDFVNGDYVLLNVQGMSQLNGRVFRVIAVSTTVSFQLEDVSTGAGLSTLLLDTFTSGTAVKVTLGTSITTAADATMSGGEFAQLDTTTIHSNIKTQTPGMASPSSIDIKHLWDVTDPGQIALKAASDGQTQIVVKLTFGVGGAIMIFNATVGHSALPMAGAGEVVKTSTMLSATGQPSYYSA